RNFNVVTSPSSRVHSPNAMRARRLASRPVTKGVGSGGENGSGVGEGAAVGGVVAVETGAIEEGGAVFDGTPVAAGEGAGRTPASPLHARVAAINAAIQRS